VNKPDSCQAANLNFGALQLSFPCPHFEVGSDPKGIVSVNLADSAVGWAFGAPALPASDETVASSVSTSEYYD
jgi:hypothetical protein